MKKFYFRDMPWFEMMGTVKWNKAFKEYATSFCEEFGIRLDDWSKLDIVMQELDEAGRLDGFYVDEDEYRNVFMKNHDCEFTDDYDTLCSRRYVKIYKDGTEQTW